ncbi:hypothetical protein BST21_12965 [Mycolicibacterium celeriflavum]|nr:hypothetical protein BST21_12965 [Mycolicibacterium celeriflavum]
MLDAALAITVEQGVSQVTIGSIAERLNVTRPVVYAGFSDRVQISPRFWSVRRPRCAMRGSSRRLALGATFPKSVTLGIS